MWEVNEVIVLSDLHLSAQRDKGLFQADVTLADCLRWILTETEDSLTVLAGDILDYLVPLEDDARIDFDNLDSRTTQIIEHHPEVFSSLSELIQSEKHRLVIMGGNHDPEIGFPIVQELFERRLGITYMNPTVRWLVHGEALRLRVGPAVVLVEHGNVLDPWNRINHAELQGAFSLATRNLSKGHEYAPPPGSRLVLDVVNELRRDYAWVDYLKPENEAVVPLIWNFCSWAQRQPLLRLAEEYLSMKVVALNQKLSNRYVPERLYLGAKESEDSPKDRGFKDWVDIAYEEQKLTLSNGKKESRLIKKLQLVSARDSFFDIDKEDETACYLHPIFDNGTDLVIHGHTHSAKAYKTHAGYYMNTGTWAQLLRLPLSYDGEDVWDSFLDLLRTNTVKGFARPTLARVKHLPSKQIASATLLEWQQPEPKTLAKRCFSDRVTGWQAET